MKQISLLGMIYLPGTFLAVSLLPRNFETAAHPHPDLLLNDLFQLDSGRKCSNDLAMARSLCGTYRATNLGDYNLVQEVVKNGVGRRKEKPPGGSRQGDGVKFISEAELSILLIFCWDERFRKR